MAHWGAVQISASGGGICRDILVPFRAEDTKLWHQETNLLALGRVKELSFQRLLCNGLSASFVLHGFRWHGSHFDTAVTTQREPNETLTWTLHSVGQSDVGIVGPFVLTHFFCRG